jgi:hypothetical protein
LSLKFSRIDPLNFSDHFHLAQDDVCYHLGEYTARKGFSFSYTNKLIVNFKKKPSVANAYELRYKAQAIEEAAKVFRSVLNSEANRERLHAVTLVPIPPSAIPGDPLYDDRMMRMLTALGRGLDLDIRELVKQHRSLPPAHETDVRPTVEELIENYYIDEDCADLEPTAIWIFDDVLTAGSHFKAMQSVVTERFPGVTTAGFFVARRIPESDMDSVF